MEEKMTRLKLEEAVELLDKARQLLANSENPNLKSSVDYVARSMEWARKAIENRLDGPWSPAGN
jgi:uncharacterized protein (DUF2132 family)